ncbi:nucleoside/nucleotide kinase family protein [Williamsia deligens]|uniref:Uridine kinase n=1 Tax=Williamsia deligens TaxID=321325 RepID=A0ABW3GB21_9NOCA|nr:hypothetical protein [Williamsia deligens]MCP2195360.1 hypothetical protein [Williamsia deligens]
MRYRPLTPEGLVRECADTIAARRGRVVVAVDGADAADPVALAQEVAHLLRSTGRAADVVDTRHWLRPASLRMEWGRTDEHSYRTAWFDHPALRREVVDALRERGTWLPRLWDPDRDRSFRDTPRDAGADQVVLIAGALLVGSELDVDVTVALRMSEGALRRRTPDTEQWTITPLLEHAAGSDPADLEVRYEHPERPALRQD